MATIVLRNSKGSPLTNTELDNKNLVSVSKVNATLSIGLHQFNNDLNKLSKQLKIRYDLIEKAKVSGT